MCEYTEITNNLAISITICLQNEFRNRSLQQRYPYLQRYPDQQFTKKQQSITTIHWISRNNWQFKCRSTVITCGDLITKYPQEHCCRFVSGKTEARKLVSAMKETVVYTRNVDAFVTSLENVIDNIPVQLSIPKKTSLQEHSTDIAAKISRRNIQCPIQDISTPF